jgi:DNA-binding Xre family transcriptional regulator
MRAALGHAAGNSEMSGRGHPVGMPAWSWSDTENAERLGLYTIAEGIRTRRLLYRLTQRQLAWRTGVDQSTISRLENARISTMKLSTLARIIGTLELGPRFLFPRDPLPPTRRLPGEKPSSYVSDAHPEGG